MRVYDCVGKASWASPASPAGQPKVERKAASITSSVLCQNYICKLLILVPALGRVLKDVRDADGFCLKKINNILGIFI